MSILWIDCETFSEENIRTAGTGRYAEVCELMLVTWALDNGPVHTWDLMKGECDGDLAGDVARTTQLRAANAPFDRSVLAPRVECIPSDPEKWACLVVRAYRAGWPRGGLDYLCEHLGIPMEDAKLKDGKRLIQVFCKPRKPTKKLKMTRYTYEHKPQEWEAFKEYARQDVVALRACWERLPGMNDTPLEAALWNLDQQVNDRGWPVDIDYARNANAIIQEEKVNINARLTKLTNGRVNAATEVEKMRVFINDQLEMADYPARLPTLDAEVIEQLLARPDIPQLVRDVAECRREGGRATNAKYGSLLVTTNSDNRLRHALQYGGAPRTLRWSGRKFQPHNLVRPGSPGKGADGKNLKPWDSRAIAEMVQQGATLEYIRSTFHVPVLELLAFGIRSAIRARPGFTLVKGDLSQIEARMVNWLAGNQRMLDIFADPEQDPYVYAAQRVGSSDRQLGKVQTLSCGYGIGGDGYVDIANKPPYSMGLTSDIGARHVKDWRNANPEIVSFWYDMNAACINAIQCGTQEVCRRITIQCWEHAGVRYLGLLLPSGRWLCYPHARVVQSRGRSTIEYWSEYGWQRTHGGPIVGVTTQSLAREVIGLGMLRAASEGFPIIGHVHDEIVAEVPLGDERLTPALMDKCLTTMEPWMEGLPLASECEASVRYSK